MLTTDFVKSYIEAWNRHDPRQVADHLASGGTYCDIPAQQQLSREEFVSHLRDYFHRENGYYTLVGDILTGDNTIAFQYRVDPAEPGGRSQAWMGAEFITMAGDSAVRIDDYYRDPLLASRLASSAPGKQRYAKSGLDAAGLHAVKMRLGDAMDNEQLYLDSHLSLPQLADRLGCSVNHLSQAINEGYGVSFFDFVNGYRVREATRLLSTASDDAASILDVALAVGFNSTSTFYAAFKKLTGQTPARYRLGGNDEFERG